MPILGSNNIQRIERFSQVLEVELDRQSWFELFEAANGGEVA
jgi:predicted oxidoreductase